MAGCRSGTSMPCGARVKAMDFIQAEEPSYYSFEKIESRFNVERFTNSPDEKNQSIVKLLLAGYTQVEIANRIGFTNHYGVCKRIYNQPNSDTN
jgi:hypothetical protein